MTVCREEAALNPESSSATLLNEEEISQKGRVDFQQDVKSCPCACHGSNDTRWYTAPFTSRAWLLWLYFGTGIDVAIVLCSMLTSLIILPFTPSGTSITTWCLRWDMNQLGFAALKTLQKTKHQQTPRHSRETFAYFALARLPLAIFLFTSIFLLLLPSVFFIFNWIILLACPSQEHGYDPRVPTTCHEWLNLPQWPTSLSWIFAGLFGSLMTIPIGALLAYFGAILFYLMHSKTILPCFLTRYHPLTKE